MADKEKIPFNLIFHEPDDSSNEPSNDEVSDAESPPVEEDDLTIDYLKKPSEDELDLDTQIQKVENLQKNRAEKAPAKKKKDRKRRKRLLSNKQLVFGLIILSVIVGGMALYNHWMQLQLESSTSQTHHSKIRKRRRKRRPPPKKGEDTKKVEAKTEPKLSEKFTVAETVGNNAFDKGKYQKALEVFMRILPEIKGRGKTEAKILYKIGECYRALHNTVEATHFYKRAADLDLINLDLYIHLSEQLNQQKRFIESIEILKKAKQYFPLSTQISIHLADAYYDFNKKERALLVYKKLDETALDLEHLEKYASLLKHNLEKDNARRVYMVAAEKFQSPECFLAAADLTDDYYLKTHILESALSKLKNISQTMKSSLTIMLARCKFLSDRPNDASLILDDIDSSQIPPQDFMLYINLLLMSGKTQHLYRECMNLVKQNPHDIELNKALQNSLLFYGRLQLCQIIYHEWQESHRNDPYANYFYGRALDNEVSAPIYLLKATKLFPPVHEASYELLNLYLFQSKWAKTKRECYKYIKLRPKDMRLRYFMALARLYSGEPIKAYKNYQSFLDKTSLSDSSKALEAIRIAQKIPNPKYTNKCLEILSSNPLFHNKYQIETIRTKLIYGTLKDSDFHHSLPVETINLHILYLLGKGDVNQARKLVTGKGTPAYFWKIFLWWRNNLGNWRIKAKTLLADSRLKPVYRLVAAVWLNNISPEDAMKIIPKFNIEDRPLVYFILAEKYKKIGKKVKARICYLKATKMKLYPAYSTFKFYKKLAGF